MKTKLKKYLTLAVVVMGVVGTKAWAANTDFEDATITVTPVAAVSLTLTNTPWAIGSQDVNTSTVSSTAMRLTNTGDIDITVQAKIQSQSANWSAHATSTMTVNNYMLSVATSSFQPAANGSQFGSGTVLGILNNSIPLPGLSGSAVGTVASTAFVDLYYKLDMPVTVNSTAQRTTVVRFTGTAN